MLTADKQWQPMEFAVTVGFDALRIATGKRPKHHDLETIIRWLRGMAEPAGRQTIKESGQ